jgi:hypothetical protein
MTAQYHDAIDRREAKERAEQFEREQADHEQFEREQAEREQDKPLCICLERIGDNGLCPVHGAPRVEFGSNEWWDLIAPIEF